MLPSGQEGFGIVFLEAMFFGAPVIAAREKGAVDVIRDNETGLLVDYGDVVGLAGAISRVLEDRALAEHLRRAARANVIHDGCFTATAFTRRLAALLSEAAAPRKVVFVNRYFHPDESATSRMLSDLARRLARGGQPVAVVTSRQRYDDADAQLPARGEVDGVIVHRVATARQGRATMVGRALDYLSFHVAAYLKLRRILKPGDIVVAKTDPPLLSVSVALAARARRATLVNWLQDVFPEVATELGVAVRPAWLGACCCACATRRCAARRAMSPSARAWVNGWRRVEFRRIRCASSRIGPIPPRSSRDPSREIRYAPGWDSPTGSWWGIPATSGARTNSKLFSARRGCCAMSPSSPS